MGAVRSIGERLKASRNPIAPQRHRPDRPVSGGGAEMCWRRRASRLAVTQVTQAPRPPILPPSSRRDQRGLRGSLPLGYGKAQELADLELRQLPGSVTFDHQRFHGGAGDLAAGAANWAAISSGMSRVTIMTPP